MNHTDSIKRESYERFKEKLSVMGAKPHVITESFLRVEEVLTNGQSTYLFDILQKAKNNFEQKLNVNDLFYTNEIGFYIYQRDTTKSLQSPLQTYPNESHFTGSAGFEVKDLMNIYHGKYSIKVHSTTYLENKDMRDFLVVPETQKSAAGNYSQHTPDSGMRKMTPEIMLFGTGENEIELKLPNTVNLKVQNDGANLENVIVLYAKGWTAKNVTLKK